MNPVRRAIITILVIGPLAAIGAVYTSLIFDGSIPPPDVAALAQAVMPIATGGLGLAIGFALIVLISLAAIAPILYAIRSGDILTVLISLVLTTIALTAFATAKSAIQEILGVLIYLANIVLSAMVYASHKISESREINLHREANF